VQSPVPMATATPARDTAATRLIPLSASANTPATIRLIPSQPAGEGCSRNNSNPSTAVAMGATPRVIG
jgi:hypothetical protein